MLLLHIKCLIILFAPSELLKNDGQELVETLHKIVDLIWVKEEMPEEWKHGLICPVYKETPCNVRTIEQ